MDFDFSLSVWIVILLALVFDFLNGMHDAANSIATIVSTRVLSPQAAVFWAAFFNFVAFAFFGLKVANNIAKGVVDPALITVTIVGAGLVGATVWNIVTWYFGIPSSSSHALVGGFAGSAVAAHGFDCLISEGLIKIGSFIIIAPLLGMAVGWTIMVLTMWAFRKSAYSKVSGLFRKLQFVSAALYSLGHGGNDAQKTMGIIFAVLIASKNMSPKDPIPLWIVLTCHLAMGLGTLAGGWRIVKTMGSRICHLQPVHGFSAETGGALCLYGASALGIPVSTTHTITGAIVGVGSTRGKRAVRWSVAGTVVWAWILTIPASAAVSAISYWIIAAVAARMA
jgi:PiT family inorganic phosphate transporter